VFFALFFKFLKRDIPGFSILIEIFIQPFPFFYYILHITMISNSYSNITDSINPVTREKMGETPVHTREDFLQMLAKARAVQPQWAALPVKERARYIIKIRSDLEAHSNRLAEIIARDTGKLRIDALTTEILPAAIAVHYNCKHAKRFLKEQKLKGSSRLLFNKRSRLIRVPYGVIGIISPWNYPFAIPFYQVIQALLAGNAVILKAATETQMVTKALQEVIDSARLPEHLFNWVNMPGPLAGKLFLEGGVDKLCFIGSVEVGKWLMAKAAETLTPLNLELGGNDAMIICEDADLYRAAGGAVWAGLANAGQSCGSVERIYVHERVYRSFIDILKSRIEHLRVGYDQDFNLDMGAMTTEKQFNKVTEHIHDALKKGAHILIQAKMPEDPKLHNLMPATVLIDVNHDMDVMRHETFGPVLGVMKVKDMEQAVELANDSYLGLTVSVWSKNHKKAMRIGRKVKAGTITINDHLMSHGLPETSWGGFKQSGIGRSHGRLGMEEMTQPQTIVNDIMPFVRKNLWWQPYSQQIYEGVRSMITALYGKKIFSRFRAFHKLMKIFPRIFKLY
jgi:succinate-semialdehyde dehydrogenase/glutarate-semialdehyde dehydrogenase